MLRLLGLLVATTMVTIACANGGADGLTDGDSLTVTSSSTTAAADSVAGGAADREDPLQLFVSGLVGLAVPTDRYEVLLTAGCSAWIPEAFQLDSASFNEWIYDLFGSGGAGNSLSEIDAAITRACEQHQDDPAAFVASVLDDLGLSVSDLLALVEDACARYALRRLVNADDPFAPEPIDPLVGSVLAEAGIDRAGALEVVDDFCGV